MKEILGNNILTGITDVTDLLVSKKRNTTASLNWVYRTYERYGNVLVSKKIFNKLDKARLGNFKTEKNLKIYKEEADCLIIWKI